MSVELGKDEVFSAAVEGLPKVAELIATFPVEDRGRALEAAEQSYLDTARELGYPEADARQSTESLTKKACNGALSRAAAREPVVCRSRDSRRRRPPSAATCPAARCGFRRSARGAAAVMFRLRLEQPTVAA